MDPRRRTSLGPSLPEGTGEDILRRLSRTFSRKSHGARTEDDLNEEEEDDASEKTKIDTWRLASTIKEIQLNDPAQGRNLGVTWKNLTVKVVPSEAVLQENVFSQFNLLQQAKEARHKATLRSIVDNSSGCVKPGEMLLVLGRPGSGCTTLLKLLANKRKGFSSIEGDIHFGSLDHKEAEQYRGSIVMNTEEELFYPTLTVGRTMDFATRLNIPNTLPANADNKGDFQAKFKSFLLDSMGISHTKDTKVGDAFVRGVSGGERKRVSIIETLCTRGSVMCWDNSNRGLDASSALEYTRALRSMTNGLGIATIVTLYQAGNGIYDLFDKILVLDEGKQVFYGSREEAQPFMESQGFICGDGANVADFLTGVTVPSERMIKPGFETRFPRNNTELEQVYRQSTIKARMDNELNYPTSEEARTSTSAFQEACQIK